MTKIHVYFMPGLAASSSIFEGIKLPIDTFEMHFLEWEIPNVGENLKSYAKRMAKNVKHDEAVLIGVSFGGVLVQEMKQFLNPKKVIIISSVKSQFEMPKRMRFVKKTKVYKLIPTKLIENIEVLSRFIFGSSFLKQRFKLYEKFLSVRDKRYLDWAIQEIVNWDRKEVDKDIIHIHGDEDEIFPPEYISDFIPVKRGTHILILNKYHWLNENLPNLILK
jgi:pimeloyl-ACP methyl ester carboxylesterase